MQSKKVLIFDIETAPMLAYVFERKDQFIGLNQIKQDWYVLAWSAKWLGDPASKIMYHAQQNTKPMNNDKHILEILWKLLNEADIVITQNGRRFDSKKLNARFILHGMPPPRPYQHLDTLQLVKRVAAFTSNSLEYLTHNICTKYKKLSHRKFSGIVLWSACLAGNKQAWAEMKKYNQHDVLSTEELYLHLQPWFDATAPRVYVSHDQRDCTQCGALKSLFRNGTRTTKSGRYWRLGCNRCGAYPEKERYEETRSVRKA